MISSTVIRVDKPDKPPHSFPADDWEGVWQMDSNSTKNSSTGDAWRREERSQ